MKKKLPHHHQEEAVNLDFLLGPDQAQRLASSLKQLNDPTRLEIFWILCHREECVINLASLMDMSSPAVSHHLRSLKLAGLIQSRREGKEMIYSARKTKLVDFLIRVIDEGKNL